MSNFTPSMDFQKNGPIWPIKKSVHTILIHIMWENTSLIWASQSSTSHKKSFPVECTIFLDVYDENPKLKHVDHSPYCNFKSPSPLIQEEFHVKEYVVIYLFKLSLCIPNLKSIASMNCTQHGLEDTGVHYFQGVTQSMVHSTMHPPHTRTCVHLFMLGNQKEQRFNCEHNQTRTKDEVCSFEGFISFVGVSFSVSNFRALQRPRIINQNDFYGYDSQRCLK